MIRSFCLYATILLTGSSTHTLHAAPAPAATADRPFIVGVCTHFGQRKGVIDRNLDRIQRAHIDSIRDEISWGSVEREKGTFSVPEHHDRYARAAAKAGAAPLIIFDYGNRHYGDGDRPRTPEAREAFAAYAVFLVRHFGPAVRLYEVWNEWDIGIGLPPPHRKGGSPEDYVELLKVVYPRVKAADPRITVMAGASTSGAVNRGWFEGILKLGAINHCDALSVHAYNYSGRGAARTPEACIAWLQGVTALIRRYNKGKDFPLHVTEVGWPTHRGKRSTPEALSAAYLARLYLGARMLPSLRGLWWYDFQDDGWNPEHNEDNFGIVRPDLTPKPAYYAMRTVTPLVRSGVYEGRLKTKDEKLQALRFSVYREEIWALWSADNARRHVVLSAAEPPERVTITEAGRETEETPRGYRPWARSRGALDPKRFSVTVGPMPVLLAGTLAGVSIADVRRLDPEEQPTY